MDDGTRLWAAAAPPTAVGLASIVGPDVRKYGGAVSYRNKTYVAFASENIRLYRLMEAWRENDKIDFDFFDAHDLYVSRDTSKPETIKRNLRQRMSNAKQVVIIGTPQAKKKGGDGQSFLAYEVDVMMEFGLPVVVANHDGDKGVDRNFIPQPLLDANYFTISVAFSPAIVKFALDRYVAAFKSNRDKAGPHY
ncbi:MAG: TIR domain-containing protein, partial [Propionicimonas sp.]